MLTPIVRTASGARRGMSRAAIAQTAADADSSGSATTQVVAAPQPVARRNHTPLPPDVAVAAPIVLDGDAAAMPIDPMRRLPLYCAECRPRDGAARRIAIVLPRRDGRSAGRRVAGRDRRHAESGGRASRAACCVAGRESRMLPRLGAELWAR
ncbi:hypothetical protein [Burkholderia sp. Bp9143]|uniref:hypothetical protein n=1 Tax=Burkholderia sp. Bp9143 TaxID=2184574 RepID=UPI000F59C6F4|nr:hypothetical protein [Burkholderia sp. Bp9143]